MRNRPFFIWIVAILHMLEPVTKIIYFWFSTDFSFGIIFNNIFSHADLISQFEFWLLFPVAGVCLLLVKSWAYIIFYFLQIYSLYLHATYERFTWPYFSDRPLTSSLILLFINIGIMIFFLLPHIRKPFWDRRMRWWETKKRFYFGVKAKIVGENIFDGVIENISLTGCFIVPELKLGQGEEVRISFEFLNYSYNFKSYCISHHSLDINGEKILGSGFKFLLESTEKKTLKQLIQGLSFISDQYEIRKKNKLRNTLIEL